MASLQKQLAQIEKKIERHIPTILHQVGLMVEEQLKKYIMENLYLDHTPLDYTRTYDYINSIMTSKVEKVGGSYQVKIYFDTNRIRQTIVEGSWNQHMNTSDDSETWGGKKVSELLPYFIEYGVEGSLYDREGINAVKYTTLMIEYSKRHVMKMAELLKQRGFNVEVR